MLHFCADPPGSSPPAGLSESGPKSTGGLVPLTDLDLTTIIHPSRQHELGEAYSASEFQQFHAEGICRNNKPNMSRSVHIQGSLFSVQIQTVDILQVGEVLASSVQCISALAKTLQQIYKGLSLIKRGLLDSPCSVYSYDRPQALQLTTSTEDHRYRQLIGLIKPPSHRYSSR